MTACIPSQTLYIPKASFYPFCISCAVIFNDWLRLVQLLFRQNQFADGTGALLQSVLRVTCDSFYTVRRLRQPCRHSEHGHRWDSPKRGYWLNLHICQILRRPGLDQLDILNYLYTNLYYTKLLHNIYIYILI